MTTATSPSPSPGYISAAFLSQYNVILLGGSVLYSLASASALPFAIAITAEMVWLMVGPQLPAFRRTVEQRLESARHAQLDEEVMHGMRTLDTEHTSRLLAVAQAVSLIALHAEATPLTAEQRAALGELEQLRPAFLRLCKLHERLSARLQEMRLSPPEQEVTRLSQAYAAEKDLGLRLTLHQSIKLAQRKIEQQARMVDVRRQVDLKLSMVEQSLSHLANQQQLGLAAAELVRDIHGIVAHVSGAAALEAELGDSGAASVPPGSAPVSAAGM